ncbi:MAG: nicotinate phosphoribosyltransferase [Campylobacter sp.]
MQKIDTNLLMDLYELTMSNGYFLSGKNKQVVFDFFYRKNPDNGGFAIFAGLEQIIEYIQNLHFNQSDIKYLKSLNLFSDKFLQFLKDFKFSGDIYAFEEGSVIYPQEPILTVVAKPIDAQIIETMLLATLNHQSLIATKARRIVKAAAGKNVVDFGARRAHNIDAAFYGARAAYIGGVSATATLMAGKNFNLPVSGTMAHSWIMYFGDEFEAFKRYALMYPDNVVLLVDTYDVIHSGVPNAIRVAKEILAPLGKRLKAVRLDSGDLAYLSKKVRSMLDLADLKDCQIFVSNSLDEYTITSILAQGGAIDGFGVGERLITSKSDPVFGGVYKLAAVEKETKFEPRIKLSEAVEKITNPGFKQVWRIYDKTNHAIADLITLADEIPNLSAPYRYIDPEKPWEIRNYKNCTAKKMLNLVIKNGKRVNKKRNLDQIKQYVKNQLENEIWSEEQRFENPHKHYVDMSIEYYEMKMRLLKNKKYQDNLA